MPQRTSTVEFNNFSKGLMTEASPLAFPEGYTSDEVNFNLDRTNKRFRRLGMDMETGFSTISTQSGVRGDGELSCSGYLWIDALEDLSTQIAVVQVGEELKFYNASQTPISNQLIHTRQLSPGVGQLQFTSISGMLIVVGDGSSPITFEFKEGNVEESSFRLEVRDIWGLEDLDPITSEDLRAGVNITIRPRELSDNHLYNLRNQGWSTLYRLRTNEKLADAIYNFQRVPLPGGGLPYGVYPSNGDNINLGVFPDPGDDDDRTGDRFHPDAVRLTKAQSTEVGRGSFLIDLLRRGVSRQENMDKFIADVAKERDSGNSENTHVYEQLQGTLNTDQTPGGPTCIESFAGRAWYAGFSPEVIGGDKHSPLLSSYVAFSQLVRDTTDMGRCYQANSPTSKDDSDLVDTDGGLVRIIGAEKIVAMREVGRSLLIFATNGVWSIDGGTEAGFTATNYRSTKVTSAGCVSAGSVVVAEDSAFYWADDGIYLVSPAQIGIMQATNISKETIQTLYQNIPVLDKIYCKSEYDSFERKIHWLYSNRPNSSGKVKELIFDIDLTAFIKYEIDRGDALTALVLKSPIFNTNVISVPVTSDGQNVTANDLDVVVDVNSISGGLGELIYVSLTSVGASSEYSFSRYISQDFSDWPSLPSGGVDPGAFLQSGPITYGDTQRAKQPMSITTHMVRTETGFEIESNNLRPIDESSCLMSARWDWSNSANSNRWSPPQQIYRYKRLYMPQSVSDPYDNGHETIITKNKIRGRGKSFSLRFDTEARKDCQILGWSMIVSMNEST